MVDDNPDDRMVAERCYRRSRHKLPFLQLTSGDALLEYLEGVASGERPMPALVLLDINMPGLNGFEALEQVRQQEIFREVPVVMMLTNSDNPDDIRRSRELGASDFFVKPMRLADYVQFFENLPL